MHWRPEVSDTVEGGKELGSHDGSQPLGAHEAPELREVTELVREAL